MCNRSINDVLNDIKTQQDRLWDELLSMRRKAETMRNGISRITATLTAIMNSDNLSQDTKAVIGELLSDLTGRLHDSSLDKEPVPAKLEK